MAYSAASINERFHRSPFRNSLWSPDGTLADAGLLIHVLDGWEENGQMWAPGRNGPGATDQSGSLVCGQNKVAGQRIPLFGGRAAQSGIIFKPGSTRVKCGKPSDSSGKCIAWCDRSRASLSVPWSEAIDKQCAWQPKDFGVQLKRLVKHQVTYSYLWYNEIIIDAVHWRAHMPDVVEAIFGNRDAHQAFLAEFDLSERSHPFLELDSMDWTSPFREG